MEATLDHDTTLDAATCQRNNALNGSLSDEVASLKSANSLMTNTIGTLREDNARVREELTEALRAISEAMTDAEHIRTDKDEATEQANVTIRELYDRIDSLNEQIDDLERDHSPDRKRPRRYTPSPTISDYRRTSSHQSNRASPIAEDHDYDYEHEPVERPQLINRMASPTTQTSLPTTITLTTPSPFYESVGLMSLLPLLIYKDRRLTVVPGSAITNERGDIKYQRNSRYVVATPNNDGWTTTLHKGSYFLEPTVQNNLEQRIPIPIANIIRGGRDGVLVNERDPSTDEKMEELLSDPSQHARAAGFVERVRFTPPELRSDVHQHALERWPEIEAARRKTYKSNKNIEPPCTASNSVWRRWLRETKESSKDQGESEYSGIPCVHNKYQDAHIEGAKAMIAFLPTNARGFATRGPIRKAFIRAAAMLLCVPAQYTKRLTQMGLNITQNGQLRYYDTSRFGDENHTGSNEVVRYLASIGTTAEQAEQWRAWATAYVDMEIKAVPNSSHATQLREAQAQAHECIDQDHTLILQNVSRFSPGYYTPGAHAHRTTRMQNNTRAHQLEMGNTEADQSDDAINNDVQMQHIIADNADENDDQISYGNELEDIEPMGPV